MLGHPAMSPRASALSHGASPWDWLAAGPPYPQHVSLAGLDPACGPFTE